MDALSKAAMAELEAVEVVQDLTAFERLDRPGNGKTRDTPSDKKTSGVVEVKETAEKDENPEPKIDDRDNRDQNEGDEGHWHWVLSSIAL